MIKRICPKCNTAFFSSNPSRYCWSCRDVKKHLLSNMGVFDNDFATSTTLTGRQFRDNKGRLWIEQGDSFYDP